MHGRSCWNRNPRRSRRRIRQLQVQIPGWRFARNDPLFSFSCCSDRQGTRSDAFTAENFLAEEQWKPHLADRSVLGSHPLDLESRTQKRCDDVRQCRFVCLVATSLMSGETGVVGVEKLEVAGCDASASSCGTRVGQWSSSGEVTCCGKTNPSRRARLR